MKKILLAALFTFLPAISFAHEGHDKAPGAVAAPHGGIMQGTSQLYLELLTTSDGVKIYPLTHDLKPIAASEVKIEGKALFPKKSKAEAVKLVVVEDAFAAKIDAKGSHRYTLEVSITYQGKKEKTKFNVEPQ